MTPLVAVIVIVLAGVLGANVISRARSGVRSVRSHHRALDTLGHITTKRPVAAHQAATTVGALSAPDTSRQAHIRILPAVVEEEEDEVEDEPVPEPAAEIDEPAPAPPEPRFRLAPAPDNDLWDIVAIRELVDGPDEPEETDAPDGADNDPAVLEGGSELVDDGDALDGNAETSADDVTGPVPVAADIQPEHAVLEGAAAVGAGAPGHHFGANRPVSSWSRKGWPGAGRSAARSTAPVGPGRPRRRHWPLRGTRRVVATTTVLALGIATVAVVLTNRHHPAPAAAATPQVTTVTPVLRPSSLRLRKPKPAATHVTVRLVSAEPGALHYHLAGGARVTLKANGPCWVEIRRTDASGQEIYTATMAAGATESVKAPAWVRLGRPAAVAVIVGGATVTPPVVGGLPYDLLFD